MASKAHLFTVTHWLLKAATWLNLFGLVVLALALGAIAGMMLGIIPVTIPPEELQKVSMPLHQVLLIAFGLLAALWVALALVALGFHITTRIVESAISGNPFVAENAQRLELIGALLLTIQGIGFIVNAIMNSLPKELEGHLGLDLGPSPIGMLSVLLIFVLAQIFRHGSEMREELEGTV